MISVTSHHFYCYNPGQRQHLPYLDYCSSWSLSSWSCLSTVYFQYNSQSNLFKTCQIMLLLCSKSSNGSISYSKTPTLPMSISLATTNHNHFSLSHLAQALESFCALNIPQVFLTHTCHSFPKDDHIISFLILFKSLFKYHLRGSLP